MNQYITFSDVRKRQEAFGYLFYTDRCYYVNNTGIALIKLLSSNKVDYEYLREIEALQGFLEFVVKRKICRLENSNETKIVKIDLSEFSVIKFGVFPPRNFFVHHRIFITPDDLLS